MNNARRKRIDDLISSLESLKSELEEIVSEEEEYKDNMPENLHESERYYNSESDCDNLNSALSSLEEAVDYLGDSKE